MVNSQTLRRELEPISPTALGSFVKLERCDQYLGWKYLADDLIGDGERFEESILSPLYAESGTRFEADQLRALLNQLRVDTVITPEDDMPDAVTPDQTWEDDAPDDSDGSPDTWESCLNTLLDQIAEVSEAQQSKIVVCFQPSLQGQVGAWTLAGKPDIIVIRPTRSGTDESGVVVDVLEVKASAGEQTHHRIQAACYTNLIQSALADTSDAPVDVTVSAKVVNRENSISNSGYQSLEDFALEPAETDVELLLQAHGRVDKILFETEEGEFESDDVTLANPWEMYNRMSRRCAGCSFHDVCYTRGVEEDGLTEQMSRTVYVVTTERAQEREIHGVTYRPVTVTEQKFFGYQPTAVGSNQANVSSIEKTLVDCADHPEFCGGISELAKAMQNAVDTQCSWERVVEYLRRVGNGAATKRLVYLADQLNIDLPEYRDLIETFTTGYPLLDPTREATGTRDSKFQLRLNVDPQSFLPNDFS